MLRVFLAAGRKLCGDVHTGVIPSYVRKVHRACHRDRLENARLLVREERAAVRYYCIRL